MELIILFVVCYIVSKEWEQARRRKNFNKKAVSRGGFEMTPREFREFERKNGKFRWWH